MRTKTALFFMSLLVFISCSEEDKISEDFENLQEYIIIKIWIRLV